MADNLYDNKGHVLNVGGSVNIVRQLLSGVPIAQINGFQLYAPQGGGSATITSESWRNMAFDEQFYAYYRGRINNANGEGIGWYKRLHLLHISDTHKGNSQIEEAIRAAQSRCDVMINTGDDANSATHDAISSELSAAATSVATANTQSKPYIYCAGNHDVPLQTKQEVFDIMGDLIEHYSPTFVFGDAAHYKLYGYYDIKPNDNIGTIRIISLDPFDYPDGSYGGQRAFSSATFSQSQIDWLIATLDDARTNGYAVITMMHYSFGDNSLYFNEEKAKPDATYYQDAFMIPDIIDAFQHGTALTKTYSDSKNVENISVNISSSVAQLEYICHLFGHIHSKNDFRCQKTDGSKIYDILMLGEAAISVYGNALNKAYREPNTVNNIAFSMLSIDTVEKCIYRVAYGSYLNYDGTNNVTNRIKKFSYVYND